MFISLLEGFFVLSWPNIENDLRTALIQKATDIQIVVGGDRANVAASEFLGVKMPAGFAAEHIGDNVFESLVDVSSFAITDACLKLYELASNPAVVPIERSVDWQDDLNTLDHFLSLCSRSSLVGDDYDLASLRGLSRHCQSYIDFMDAAVRAMTTTTPSDDLYDLTIGDLAHVGNVQQSYVRNNTSPDPLKGRIRSEPRCKATYRKPTARLGNEDRSFVKLNTLDSIEWLVTLRRFRHGRLSTQFINECIHHAESAELLGRIVAIGGWLNVGDTATLLNELRWPHNKFQKWVGGSLTTDSADAKAWASVLGIDAETYSLRVNALA
ncbi:MAG: hypothetical protein QM698_05795 [Micropepsaceae bacterium]